MLFGTSRPFPTQSFTKLGRWRRKMAKEVFHYCWNHEIWYPTPILPSSFLHVLARSCLRNGVLFGIVSVSGCAAILSYFFYQAGQRRCLHNDVFFVKPWWRSIPFNHTSGLLQEHVWNKWFKVWWIAIAEKDGTETCPKPMEHLLSKTVGNLLEPCVQREKWRNQKKVFGNAKFFTCFWLSLIGWFYEMGGCQDSDPKKEDMAKQNSQQFFSRGPRRQKLVPLTAVAEVSKIDTL